MRKDLLAIGLGMVLSGVTLFSSLAADTTVTLRGHVPAIVARGKVRPLGDVDGEKTMLVSISLPLRNRETLTNLLAQIYDPNSPNYGHYLTPQQFAEHFGPTEKQYQAVIGFAQSHKLTVVEKHASRAVLTVRGTASDIEKAFQVTLHTYQHPTENRIFFAPDTEPKFDASLPILQVSGLDDFSIPRPFLHKRNPSQMAKNAPAAGSAPGGAYQGNDFRNAYVPGTTLTGTGQNVGLLQFDGFYPSDIAAYETQIGLGPTVPNLVVVPIDGGVPVPTSVGNPEVSLDIENVISMAPGVGNIYVYEAPNPSPWVDILSRMADDNLAKQLSASWGSFDGPNPAAEQIFQQMALQGQTYFNASGDSDAFVGPIFFPSDSPNITLVGGTTLTTGRGAVYNSETVWNWGITMGLDGIGSSGGTSTFYPIPSWQTNIDMPSRGGSSTFRNIPDVALTADNVWVIFGSGKSGVFGGTSCAAPLWAGFTALANQQAVINAHPPLGFLNPALYAIANSPSYATSFHDTVAGNNTWSQSPNLFFAAPGYDLCTGLGTPNGTNLINALLAETVAPTHISPPSPPYGTNLSALNGGNPNGSWSLFMQDDAPISSGFVSDGWILSLTTADVVGTAADLELLMSTATSNVFVGQPVTFVLTVTNYGPSISTNVSVVDTLPLTVSIVSSNATVGSVTRSGSTLIWNVGTLNTNTGGGLVLTVQPSGIGSLVNSANASAGTPDPNPDEDSAFSTVNVVPLSATLTPSYVSSNGTFNISIPGPTNPSLTVVIQVNSNLISTNWVNIYTGTPPINFTDPGASNYVRRFYRALLLP
jgi:uncharacterized repeat protein (TIGR01451 family)